LIPKTAQSLIKLEDNVISWREVVPKKGAKANPWQGLFKKH
jgi:hypothetical protein